MKTTYCIAEDRETCEPCLKLLLLSLQKYDCGRTVSLFYPPAKERFLQWLERCPAVQMQTTPLKNGYGWNVKPQAIMQLLDQGFDEVIWVDSDVIVAQNLQALFSQLDEKTVIVTEHTLAEERDDRDAKRARSWGLAVGRVFPFALSSGVVRVTRANYRLMQRWWELLQSEEYQYVQRLPWQKRPPHMLGDQDVLTALLSSQEFSQVPVRILLRGRHIIQFDGVYGYTVAERMRNLLGHGPAFVHSGAGKPWSDGWKLASGNFLREYIKSVYLDLSPYTLFALQFRDELDCRTEWMEPHYALSRILRAIGLQYAPLVGFPMAIFADAARLGRHALHSFRSLLSHPENDGLQPSDK